MLVASAVGAVEAFALIVSSDTLSTLKNFSCPVTFPIPTISSFTTLGALTHLILVTPALSVVKSNTLMLVRAYL